MFMETMKKISMLVLAALVMGFTACGGKGSSSVSKQEGGNVTINFYLATDHQSFVDKLVVAYNGLNRGIKVVAHYTPNDDYDDKLKVLAASALGEMDAMWIRTPAQTQQYITNNALVDLSPYAAATGLDLGPIKDSSLLGASRDGKFYGLPTSGSCWLLFYNKDLFDAKGIPYPVNITWDQYLELTKQLTYTEGKTKYWGGMIPPWTMNLGASAAGEYLTAAEPMPLTRRYAEVLYRAYTGDKSHPGIAEMNTGTWDVNAYFGAGNIYTMINGDWEFSLLKTDFTFACAPLPVFPGVHEGASVGQSSYYCVSKNSKYPKEAYDFIEWALTSPAGTTIFAEASFVPNYPTPEALEAYQKNITVPGVEYRFSSQVAPEQGPEPYYSAVNEAFIQELQLYLLNEQSLDAMFKNFYALRKEAVENF
jgi:ABC-type glycerol-3-phosphate transport system substrate-binding protein